MEDSPKAELVAEKWTEEQKRAISHRGQDILVTAGAGSGKTRVLVERILRRITDRQNPVDLDKLLVVTFTNAAASEMKQRIGITLEKALQKNPRSQNLHRQLLLLNRATITTVHSFCLDVIRRYYYLENLDPAFRILDESGAELLRQEMLEDLLDEYYDTRAVDSPFYRLVESYSNDRGDQALQDLILRLHSFAQSHPFPGLWLQQKKEAFCPAFNSQGVEASWLEPLLEDCRSELEMILALMEEALQMAAAPGGPTPYLDTLREEIELLRKLQDAAGHSWGELYAAMQQNPFGRLKPCRGDAYRQELKERVSHIRERARKDFYKMKDSFFQRPLEEHLKELEHLKPLINALVEVVEDFADRYRQAKKEKGVADFSDLEHFALKILLHPEAAPGTLVPSRAALEYRRYFSEIMIDEYQDINQVQEAILTLVAASEPEGNRFLVGDVKQSIYRFRLAEPELFLQKQRRYTEKPATGCCIHLNRNFRSRKEVLAGVNFLFSRIMDENVGEISYDDAAFLRYGETYPLSEDDLPGHDIDFMLIHRSGGENTATTDQQKDKPELPPESGGQEGELEAEQQEMNEDELETASLEGRLIARRIKQLLGELNEEPFFLYDRAQKKYKKISYRDIAILLRSAKNFAPAILEELRREGIPAYAELGGGFFDSTEIQVMLSLLAIIDNPYQDLPLAAVLRSPLLGFTAAELAAIRIAKPSGIFFDALMACSGEKTFPRREELQHFLHNLERWQEAAGRGPLADLIWRIYRETGYYDLVGGMPAGKQRQANLRSLYDRARAYEASASRGLFRFLRFVEKLKDRGEDLEPARVLGEQEDVVRIMTVHKSKGLEFPVVFLAGLNRPFNKRDLQHHFLLHKELGFGPKFIDTENRLIYPTLLWQALKKRLQNELLAEEMRILYVAMTRAEEKLILVATVNNLSRDFFRRPVSSANAGEVLPAYLRSKAGSFLDWIGPALLHHPDLEQLGEAEGKTGHTVITHKTRGEISSWKISFWPSSAVITATDAYSPEEAPETARNEMLEKISRLELLPSGESGRATEVSSRLSWQYSGHWATTRYAKVSVSELPRLRAAGLIGGEEDVALELTGDEDKSPITYVNRRPNFMEGKKMSGTERGTAYHIVMRHLQPVLPLKGEDVRRQMETMLAKDHLTLQEFESVDPELIAAFFATSLGERLCRAYPSNLWRELPFTLLLSAEDIYIPENNGATLPSGGQKSREEQDYVLLQGVVDCLFREDEGFVLIDYKTGSAAGFAEKKEADPRYRRQLFYYSLAIEKIWGKKVGEKYLYFFDDGRLIKVGQ